MTIGREHAAGTINDEGILDYSKNMAIVLLHGGPGYGKSHVLQCMRQLNDAYNLNSLVMALCADTVNFPRICGYQRNH